MPILTTLQRRRIVLVEAVRSRLWPVPAAGVVVAVVAGVALPELDAAVDDKVPPAVARYLFGGGADAAREILAAIATSLITVTSLTFSLTLITLQLASSQYTPRLLRTFAADRFIQRTLALFLATFAYSLTVLRTVRNSADEEAVFVPQIAVTAAYLLAMAAVLALVMFLGHLVRQIRIETMLDHVSAETVKTADRLLSPRDDGPTGESLPSAAARRSVIEAASSGFLVEVDEQAVLAAAVSANAVVLIDVVVGSPVVAGVPVGFCWSSEPGDALGADNLRRVRAEVANALRCGKERTAAQDIGHGLQQLTDIVVRALSPGINDPTTAAHGLNACGAVLSELLDYKLGPRFLRDDNAELRVVVAVPELADLLDLVCTQPRHYGARDPVVVDEMMAMLRKLAWRASQPDDRQAIADQLERLKRTVAAERLDAADRSRLDGLARAVTDALDRRWEPMAVTRRPGSTPQAAGDA